MKKALFFAGGWSGHEPLEACEAVSSALEKEGFETEVTEDLDLLLDDEKIGELDLIVMCITMGEITGDQMKALSAAVESGIGFAGWHGGMCDAFRSNT
ncbi:MAG: ThuA domain-containing protein, partial [Verrucomicrobiota bacterium]